MIYLAYGSNLNTRQMKRRCPLARVYGKGMLYGYRLLFKGRKANAYATIEEKEGSAVPVLVWEITPEDERALDFYEGYPRFYEKKMVEAVLENGRSINGMVYIMTDGVIDRIEANLPSAIYFDVINQGYGMCGFDKKFLQDAIEDTKTKMKE